MLYFLYLQGVPSLEQKLFKAEISCDLFILGDESYQPDETFSEHGNEITNSEKS